MRRGPFTRLLAALLGAWFTITMVEPVALHACPMHDGHGVHAAAGAAGMVGQADDASHAHHHGPSDATEEAPANEAPGCLCVGDCSGAVPVPATPDARLVMVAVVPASVPLPALPAHAPVTRGGLVIPCANGPPVRA